MIPMDRDHEISMITTFLDHHARRTSLKVDSMATVAVDVYCSSDILAAERRLFQEHPQCVGLSTDLPSANTFCTRADLIVPTVLTRDTSGVAHAFVNVCRHRGSAVASGRGEMKRLSCPYHAWTYGLDGVLLHIPDADAFPDVDMAACGLVEIPLVEHNSMLWLLPTNQRDYDLPPYLGTLDTELADLALGSFDYWRTERLELEFNWKLVIETFLEPYHFSSLHRTTVGPYFLPNLCWVDGSAPHVREVIPRRTMLDLAGTPTDQWHLLPHAVIVHVLFPNTVLVWLLDHLETWRVIPHHSDPAKCVCELDFYLPRNTTRTTEYWEKNWEQTISTVLTEDFQAMAGVQRGLASGANTHFTVGRNEPALARFQQALANALSEPCR